MPFGKKHFCRFFILLLSIALLTPGAMAVQRVSFAEPDALTHKDIYLYYANGTLQGLYNTTSTGIEIPDAAEGDIMFVIKPQYSTPLDDPAEWLTSFLAYINTNSVVLLAAAIVIGVLFTRR